MRSGFLRIFGIAIDIFFVIDIVIAFRTTYIDIRSGAEITEIKALAKYYLLGQFFIDFLATVPFDSIAEVVLGEAGLFKFLGALKLVRVLRLNRIITYLRSTMEVKESLKLLQIIFYLIMYVHCFGCMWWLLVSDT